ncbi:MAG: glucose 1-dehydrogenase [Gammaproteobacteria bacterium]|nr:glucose 1-dehydrogenase [Gammaproteobacteria bacterium]
MNKALIDKVALITGAGRGIGAATAKTLAAAGATVIVTDIDAASARSVCEEIQNSGGQARAYTLDISDESSWQEALLKVDEEFGKLNVLINNAGIVIVKPIEETTSNELEKIARINIFGTYFGIQKSLPLLKAAAKTDKTSSSIINFSSAMGIKGYPFGATYSMSKGAIRLLTKSAALEFAQLNYPVRVNSIHPGLVETPMVEQEAGQMASYGAFGENTAEKVIEALKAYNPLGRFAEPVEIAKAVLFLASDDSSFMNGSELVVDGGETA